MIAVRGVSKQFITPRGTFQALADVTLNVEYQEFLSIIGPSGCGKTTLLKIIAGLIEPDEAPWTSWASG